MLAEYMVVHKNLAGLIVEGSSARSVESPAIGVCVWCGDHRGLRPKPR